MVKHAIALYKNYSRIEEITINNKTTALTNLYGTDLAPL